MTRRARIVSCLLAGALAPIAAGADSVHLKNGQSFDGVEAVVAGDQVRIDLAIGSMRLPMSQVDRIEEVDSTLGEFRARETRLGREPADAESWLELARWARTNDFEPGAAKAALIAARLDPELEALDPIMLSLDYVYDETAREWLPYADAMRRQGLIEDHGEWVTPRERRERSRARLETVTEEAGSRTDDHLDKALDILAQAVAKPEAPSNTRVIVQPTTVGAGLGSSQASCRAVSWRRPCSSTRAAAWYCPSRSPAHSSLATPGSPEAPPGPCWRSVSPAASSPRRPASSPSSHPDFRGSVTPSDRLRDAGADRGATGRTHLPSPCTSVLESRARRL